MFIIIFVILLPVDKWLQRMKITTTVHIPTCNDTNKRGGGGEREGEKKRYRSSICQLSTGNHGNITVASSVYMYVSRCRSSASYLLMTLIRLKAHTP